MTFHALRRVTAAIAIAAAVFSFAPAGGQAAAQTTQRGPQHAREVRRLLIRGAMVIPGTGVPAFGPADLLLEGGMIARVGSASGERWPEADAVIDATGKYVMPGIVNTHMHWHEERVGPMPIQYERNLYLASGVTTAQPETPFDQLQPNSITIPELGTGAEAIKLLQEAQLL